MACNAKQSAGESARRRTGLGAVVEAMRMPHWIKNVFVVVPILFSQRYGQGDAWAPCILAVGVFCLLSSSIYIINDIFDYARDRAHPLKRNRPVASGRLSKTRAIIAAVVLLVAGAALAGYLSVSMSNALLPMYGMGVAIWAGSYFLLNLLYSLWLKNKVIVDVLVVAMGFVLRAMAGAAAIAVAVSPWLVICTFTLCLFIALAKRRSEVTDLSDEQVAKVRKTARQYGPETVEHMLTVSAAMAILTYSLYCLAPGTVRRFGSAHMIWTVPLFVYGMFRYYVLTRGGGRGDPVNVVLRDKVMWLVVLVYIGLTLIIVKFGPDHADMFLK